MIVSPSVIHLYIKSDLSFYCEFFDRPHLNEMGDDDSGVSAMLSVRLIPLILFLFSFLVRTSHLLPHSGMFLDLLSLPDAYQDILTSVQSCRFYQRKV